MDRQFWCTKQSPRAAPRSAADADAPRPHRHPPQCRCFEFPEIFTVNNASISPPTPRWSPAKPSRRAHWWISFCRPPSVLPSAAAPLPKTLSHRVAGARPHVFVGRPKTLRPRDRVRDALSPQRRSRHRTPSARSAAAAPHPIWWKAAPPRLPPRSSPLFPPSRTSRQPRQPRGDT